MIKIKNLTMTYDGKTAVRDISFDIEKGDYFIVLGANGSGKTTLIKGILGLKKYDSGSVSLQELTQGEISYLPQKSVIARDFPATVLEVVRSGCLSKRKLFSFTNKTDRSCALCNLERLGISDLALRAFSELSGGQQQRVLLARALCSDAKLIVLDEPGAGLDPEVTAMLYGTLKQLNDEGLTVVMVTHDLSVKNYANKILTMPEGTVTNNAERA